jgi:N-methylhydantoinase A
MKSSGGLFDSDSARAHPEELVESGPAAGVIGAASVARELEISDIISFDMGGTTAKASLIDGGVPGMNYEYEVGGAAHAGGFLQKGTGYPLRVPVIDLAEVGTGGGSIAWVDEGGALRVGPRSAGASPGPVCYGRGGTEPTVTDADLALGYLDEVGSGQYLGRMSLGAARDAIKTRVADPLGMSVEVAARGIFDLANAQMADAVRLVSVAKGVDPRELTLVAFGGAGPVHAWAIAQQLLIGSILIPPYPGVYSAVGLLGADFRVDLSRGVRIALATAAGGKDLSRVFDALEARATKEMQTQGHDAEKVDLSYSADMRYLGQSYEVNVGLPVRTPVDTQQAQAAFHQEHARLYGHASDGEPVEVITARVSASIAGERPKLASETPENETLQHRTRDLFFNGEVLSTPVHARHRMSHTINGPAAIEQSDTTIIVPPGAQVRRLANGCLRLELKGSPT